MTAGSAVSPILAPTAALPAPGISLSAFISALEGTTVGGCGGFPTGQCTALACAWCRNLGLVTPCGACAAPDHCDGLCWSGGTYPGWTWVPYAPGRVPREGDLVSYHPCAADSIGASGHVGLFVSGNATRFTGFDQNWSGTTCRLISHGYECVLGWQHPPAGTPPPPPPALGGSGGLLLGALALGLGAVYVRRNHPNVHARITRRGGFSETLAPPSARLPHPVAALTGHGGGYARSRDLNASLARRYDRFAESEGNGGWILRDGRIFYIDDREEHDENARLLKASVAEVLESGVARFRFDAISNHAADDLVVEIRHPLSDAQRRAVMRLAEDAPGVAIDISEPGTRRPGEYFREGEHVRWSGEASSDRISVARLLREANEEAEAPMPSLGHGRTRTLTLSDEAVATFDIADPDANTSIYGFLLPDGRIVDIADQQHFSAARQMGDELGHLQERGFMRFVMSAHPHQRQVFVEATVPFTPAQARRLREIEDSWRVAFHIDATTYPTGQYTSADAHVLLDSRAQDGVGLRRAIAATNAALEGVGVPD